jgi:hypothetical protein
MWGGDLYCAHQEAGIKLKKPKSAIIKGRFRN